MNTQNNSLCPLVMAKGKFALSFGLYEIDNDGKLQNPIISSAFQSFTVFESDNAKQRKYKLINDLGRMVLNVNELIALATKDQLTLNEDGTLNLENLPDYLKKE